jgi:hypothetical protein
MRLSSGYRWRTMATVAIAHPDRQAARTITDDARDGLADVADRRGQARTEPG